MITIKRRSAQLSVAGVAALAIFAVAAVMLLAGGTPTQAQGTDGSTGGTPLNNWPDPQPCGPGANTASMDEPHEVTEGHFALFDAYWRTTNRGLTDDAGGVGVLHINECPPKMVPDDFSGVITRTAYKIDIEEAIMHVTDDYDANVVATNAQATAGQLSLEEYPAVREALGVLGPKDTTLPVPDGTEVWWLRLDDPDTGTEIDPMNETSDLSIGFSTALFDRKHWLTSDEGKPMRYKLEVESYPSDPDQPGKVPHFFAYKAPKADNAEAELVWDGFKPGVESTDMVMEPGEYEALQWVFTKPGTYVLLVELQGYVRHAQNKLPDSGEDWKPISGNLTETAVATYTFHVGPKLAETEPPIFGVNLSVAENSPAGTKVGDPIPVYNADAKTLYYGLTGEGKEDFKAVAGTDPHTVQIVVADGASLDHETTASYELGLTVTDKLDHEGNPNKPKVVIDDTLIVKIDLDDVHTRVELSADSTSVKVNQQVNLTATYHDLPANANLSTLRFTWKQFDLETFVYYPDVDPTSTGSNYFFQFDEGPRRFHVLLDYSLNDGSPGQQLTSNTVDVTWTN